MSASDDIFLLIDSMSSAERGYFRRMVGRNVKKGNSNYLKLFQAIEQTGSYDEKQLAKQFRGETFAQHLPSTRYQLVNLILRSLQQFYRGKSLDAELRELIAAVITLRDRGVYGLCRRTLRKARKLAASGDRHNHMLELLRIERNMLIQQQARNIAAELHAIMELEQQTIAKLRNESELDALYTRLAILQKQQFHTGDTAFRQHLDNIMAHPLLQNEDQMLSFHARAKFLYIHGNYAVLCGDKTRAFNVQQRLVTLWQKHPQRIACDPTQFRSALMNYLNICLATAQFAYVRPILDQISSLPCETPSEEVHNLKYVYFIDLTYRLQTGAFEGANTFVDEIAKKLKRFGGKLSQARRLAYYYNIALFLFFCAEYAAAPEWLEKLLQEANEELRLDLQTGARLLLPVLHFELADFDVLDSRCRAALRFLQGRKRLGAFERAFLAGMHKLANAAGTAEFHPLCTELYAELSALIARHGAAPASTELLFWLESKVERLSVRHLFTRKVQERDTSY